MLVRVLCSLYLLWCEECTELSPDDYGLDSDSLVVSLVYSDDVLCFRLLDSADSPVYVLDDPSLVSVPVELDSFFGPDDELSDSVYGI